LEYVIWVGQSGEGKITETMAMARARGRARKVPKKRSNPSFSKPSTFTQSEKSQKAKEVGSITEFILYASALEDEKTATVITSHYSQVAKKR
jgi:hypothetical protein